MMSILLCITEWKLQSLALMDAGWNHLLLWVLRHQEMLNAALLHLFCSCSSPSSSTLGGHAAGQEVCLLSNLA